MNSGTIKAIEVEEAIGHLQNYKESRKNRSFLKMFKVKKQSDMDLGYALKQN